MQLGSGVGAGSFLGKMLLFLHSGAWLAAELREAREAALLVVTATRCLSELGGQSHLHAVSALPSAPPHYKSALPQTDKMPGYNPRL